MSNDIILYSLEERPIFEYYACENELIERSIDEVLSFQPRQIIFNNCKITGSCTQSILNRVGPFIFIMEDGFDNLYEGLFPIYKKTNNDSILVKYDSGIEGLILDVNVDNYDSVVKNLFKNEHQYKLTINPIIFDKIKGIGISNFDTLYQQISDYNRAHDNPIRMYYHILPTKFIRDHPCNAYMLSECKCHSKKNNIPRHIVIECDGSMKPYDHSVDQRYIMGNVVDGIAYSLQKYAKSNSHDFFIKVCERIFFYFITKTPSIAVPWGELFVIYSKDNYL